MRTKSNLQVLKTFARKCRVLLGMMALVLTLVLLVQDFSMVSHAESQGTITASTVNIRKEASTSSDKVGKAEKGTVVTIIGQQQGSDGRVWYQVVVDGSTTGYIRSDLLEIEEADAIVEKVNPVGATVAGSSTVRVRENASTSSTIVASVTSGSAVTVTGKATGADGYVWYKVSCVSDGTQVDGFIRSDFVNLSGELTPYTEPTATPPSTVPEDNQPQEPVQQPTEETKKKYDTRLVEDVWYLVDTDSNDGWVIEDLFSSVKQNAEAYSASEKTVKSQKVVIIILVLLLVAALAGAAFLVFKIKDMMDSAYFNEVEAEALRRKNAAANQNGKAVMHTVGDNKQGARPAGTSQGTRSVVTPQGTRPAGATQGQRPVGTPQGQRPAGAPQGQRPAGAPQGQRPAGAPQGQRPVGAPQGQRPAGAPQGQRPVGAPQAQGTAGAPQGQKPAAPQAQSTAAAPQTQSKQSKNFMADDDEFEFEFLNYNGEEEQ